MNESIFGNFRFFWICGCLAIFGVAGVSIYLIQQSAANLDVIRWLDLLSPWVARKADLVSMVVSVFILIAAVAAPPLLASRDSRDDGSRLETLGFWACLLIVAAIIFIIFDFLLSLVGLGLGIDFLIPYTLL